MTEPMTDLRGAGMAKARVQGIAGKGRGLVATQALPAGAVIEIAPAVDLSSEDCDRLEATALGQYYFAHPDRDDRGLFIFGFASLVNHADDPNTEVVWQRNETHGWGAVLRTLRAVAAGEELTRRYACPPWFEVVR